MSDIRKAISSALADTHTADSTKTAYEIIENTLVEVVEREIEQLQKENAGLNALAIQVINIKNPKDVIKARNKAMFLTNKELGL